MLVAPESHSKQKDLIVNGYSFYLEYVLAIVMDRNNRKSVTGIGIYGIETPAGRYQISNR